jgi:hypothetical protein
VSRIGCCLAALGSNNSLSTFRNITCGIPPGFNLGPLLFTISINDLPNSLEITEPAMFADDTSLTATEGLILKLNTNWR